MNVLGISYGYHDASAALVKDGGLIAAAAEERFTRQKHDPNFPQFALDFCLKSGDLNIGDIDCVTFHEDPHKKFSRVLATGLSGFPTSYKEFTNSMKAWLGSKLWAVNDISQRLKINPESIKYLNHHLSHAITGFLGSGFSESAILVVDAVGDWQSAGLYKGYWKDGHPKVESLLNINFPNSLGLLYSAFTSFLGFIPNDDECSTMALAGFGKPIYAEEISKMLHFNNDGSFELNQSYFNFIKFYRGAYSDKFIKIFGEPRIPKNKLPFDCLVSKFDIDNVPAEHQRFANIAASIQFVFEESIIKLAKSLHKKISSENLCFAGGSALNCVANSKIIRSTPFKNIYVPPDPGDGGTSVGTAYYEYFQNHQGLPIDLKYTPYQGKTYDEGSDKKMLEFINPERLRPFVKSGQINNKTSRWNYESIDTESDLLNHVSEFLYQGKIVGWFQSRFELGPRALGNRSILIKPDNFELAQRLSKEVKERAGFRPYALSMTSDSATQILNFQDLTPAQNRWMQFAVEVKPTCIEKVKAAMHIDSTTRPQVCFENENPRFYRLLKTYGRFSGLEAILNTSFNPSGYPIVATPAEALIMFARTSMDVLVINNLIIKKG